MHTDDLAVTALRQLFIKPLKGAQTSHLGALCVPDSFSSLCVEFFLFFLFWRGKEEKENTDRRINPRR